MRGVEPGAGRRRSTRNRRCSRWKWRCIACWNTGEFARELLLGHSVGEIAAAHVAGVMSLGGRVPLVAARGRSDAGAAGGRRDAARSKRPRRRLLGWLSGLRGSAVAGSGERSESRWWCRATRPRWTRSRRSWRAARRKRRRLTVSHAFHSARMEPMLEEFERVVRSLKLQPAQLAIVSNVTGARRAPEHLRRPAVLGAASPRSGALLPGPAARCKRAGGRATWSSGRRAC